MKPWKWLLVALVIVWGSCKTDIKPTPPPEPDPQPPPVVVVPPVIPPPVTPPPTPPPVPSPRLRQLHVWAESSNGTQCDDFLNKVGWARERTMVHVNDTGNTPIKSRYGQTILALHCLYSPWATPPSDLNGRIAALCKRAKSSGCVAVSLDHETWTIAVGPAMVKTMYEQAHANGLPFMDVPAIGFTHLLVSRESDDWAWTRTDKGRAGMTPEQVGTWLNTYTDSVLQWNYGDTAETFVYAAAHAKSIGYNKPYIPLMEGAGRIPDADAEDMTYALWKAFGSIGVFNSRGVGPRQLAALRAVKDRE